MTLPKNADTVTEHEMAYIRENYKNMTSKQIAGYLHCSLDRVDYIEKLLSLRKYTPWTDKKTMQLKEYCGMGMRPSEMAALLNVSQKTVYNHMKKLGLKTTGSAPGRPHKK